MSQQINIDPEVWAKTRRVAFDQGTTASRMVERALREYLVDQPPVPGGTIAIWDGEYVTEERTPGPPSPGGFDELLRGVEVTPGETALLDLAAEQPSGPKMVHTPESAASVAVQIARPVRAVPKPSQAKKR